MLNPIVLEDLQRVHAAVRPKSQFDGATVVVTGCAGFLGYYILQYLVTFSRELGVRSVVGLDSFLLGRPPWLNRLLADHPRVLKLETFDIARDKIGDIEGVAEARFIIHMASVASPTFYRQYPVETIDANIWGLRNLFEFYKASTSLKGFLFFSSSEIYGDPERAAIPTSEDYRGNVSCTGPRACYDESKRFGETLCYVFAKKHGMPITVARPFNNFGPGMRVDDKRLPADFAKCVLEGRDIAILSDGSPTRTFCYISDAVAGYLLCLLHGEFDAFNIGIERPEIKVSEFAELYRELGRDMLGYAGSVSYAKSNDLEYLVDNPNRRCPDISKARGKLGYDPKIHVKDGVRRYLEFLKLERSAS